MMNFGPCPLCNGTGRMPTPNYLRKYGESNGWYGYSKEDDCCTCTNCGGQTMYGVSSGQVPLRSDGTPCLHEYTSKNVGRCLTEYTCKHCGLIYQIDSSD